VTTVEQRVGDEFHDAVIASGHGPGRQRWWLEIPLAIAFYAAYAQIRDWHGSATVHAARVTARHHGYDVLRLERWLHLDLEKGAQPLFLHVRPVVVVMNVFYGSAHFVLTVGVFLWLLFRGSPAIYRRARNVLAIGTAIGLVFFALYPTMPPRLMPAGIKTQDTMDTVGSLWSYNHGVLEHISDPYAAMPSLHIVWASFVGYVFWLLLSARPGAGRLRWLPWLYPVVTGLVVVVTGTHWVLDLAGGAVVFAIAVFLARQLDRWTSERAAKRQTQRRGG
jgi:membrane-associated phospholipid phosphatase